MNYPSAELLAALDELLDQALGLSSPRLEPWLARLRRERPDLALEVEHLLAVEPTLDARGFLGGGALDGCRLRGSPDR
jgi:hypothetical protein